MQAEVLSQCGLSGGLGCSLNVSKTVGGLPSADEQEPSWLDLTPLSHLVYGCGPPRPSLPRSVTHTNSGNPLFRGLDWSQSKETGPHYTPSPLEQLVQGMTSDRDCAAGKKRA